jgi:hypothetical protein
LNIADTDPEYRHIREMTKGIIFASHPHKGPAFHTFLKSFLRPSIFHAAQEEKIEPLVEMNNYFISTVNDINILSFWETDGVLLLNPLSPKPPVSWVHAVAKSRNTIKIDTMLVWALATKPP